MRYLNLLLLAIFALAPLELGRSQATAQKAPAPQAATRERPFVSPLPSAAEADTIAKKVVEDNDEAIKTFRGAGLTYVHRLHNYDPLHPEICRAFQAHKDWVEAMQQWEMVLVQADPVDFGSNWESLSKRFLDAEAQLARAVLYAHYYGDLTTRDALAKRAPTSAWIRAALAWCGLTADPRKAIADLLAILGASETLSLQMLRVRARHFVELDRRINLWAWEEQRKDFENVATPVGVRELWMRPEHMLPDRIVEKVAMIASESGDPKLVDETEAKVIQAAAGLSINAADIYLISARPGSEKAKKLGLGGIETIVQDLCGPAFLSYAFALPPTAWVEATLAGTAAWATTPESISTRRLMLSRVMVLGDPLLTRVAARAVLACHEDDVGAVNDLARALAKFSADKELTAAFCAALKATKHADLIKIADAAQSGNMAFLDAMRRGKLVLTLEQRAALLKPFVSQPELDTTGGLTAVYWLNRAVFMEGQRNLRAATDAHWQAMTAAGAESRDKEMSPTVLAWLMYCERNLPDDMVETETDRQSTKKGKLAAVVRSHFLALRDKDAPVAVNAWVRALARHMRWADLPEDSAKELEVNANRHGGAGVVLLAEQALRKGDFSRRKLLVEKALAMAPCDPFVNMCMGPEGEAYGTYRAANWEFAARHAIVLALVQPFSLDTVYLSNVVLMRAGGLAYSIFCRGAGALMRKPACNWASAAVPNSFMLSICRFYNSRLVQRMALARPETATGRKVIDETVYHLSVPYRDDAILRATAAVSGPANLFPRIVLQQFMNGQEKSVNVLLNAAYSCGTFWPEQSIAYVEWAEKLGYSDYGRFVGFQGRLTAHAQLGTLSEVLAEFDELRGGEVGFPPTLDRFVLCGLTKGNNVKEAAAAKAVMDKYAPDPNDQPAKFLNRRFHMMLGLHDQVGGLPLPKNSPVYLEDAVEYTKLFHEARALLDSDNFEELLLRATPYTSFSVEAGMGVYTDAAILRAIAMKLSDKPLGPDTTQKRLAVVDGLLADALMGSVRTLDTEVLDVLCGRRDLGPLSEWSETRQWHGELFGERTTAYLGAGIMSYGEAAARDKFIRGVLEWLSGDNSKARTWLQDCVKRDQRNSHEYHVAEWLLANPLKPKEGK